MSTATTPPVVDSAVRLLTAADLAVLPSELPSGTVLYELDNGKLVIMAPPGDVHGAVEANFTYSLKDQADRKGLGKVRCGEVGIVLWRDPDRVVGADAAFIANASLPLRLSPEGYLETIPELVVEVRRPNETHASLRRKAEDYLAAGVRVVWVADPETQVVTEYRQGQPPRTWGHADTLTVEDVIPGFQVPVRDLFQL
jgi:Uma2 family endonuclease